MINLLAIGEDKNSLEKWEELVRINFSEVKYIIADKLRESIFEQILEFDIDVLLLDLSQFEKQAFEIARTLKNTGVYSSLWIIFIGEDSLIRANSETIFELNPDALFTKPLNELEFLFQINSFKRKNKTEPSKTEKFVNGNFSGDNTSGADKINAVLGKKQLLYESFFEISPDIQYVYSLEKGAFFWSKRTMELLGFTPTDMEKEPFLWRNSIHKDDVKKVDKAFRKLKKGIKFDIEYRIKNRNGDYLWLRDRCIEIHKIGDENIVQGLATDITQLKRNEKILKLKLWINEKSTSISEVKYLQKFLDKLENLTDSNIGFFHFVEEDQINISLQVWSSNTINEMCQTTTIKSHYPIDLAGVWVDCVHKRKAVIHNNYPELPNKKGLPEGHAEVERELVVPVIRENKVKAIVGIGNKKSNYSPVEAELVQILADQAWDILVKRRAEQKFELIFNLSPVGFFLLDKKGQVLNGNKIIEDITGYTMSEIVGRNIADLKVANESDVKLAKNILRKISLNETAGPYTIILSNRNGKKFNIEIVIHAAEVLGKKTVLGAVWDITSQKHNEEELKRLNATKDKFFSIIAHDLKSPFNSILGFSDLILESCSNNDYEQIALMSEMLNKAAKQSYALLTNLLEWSRTQRGKTDFNPNNYLLEDIINSTVNVLYLTASEKNIELIAEYENVFIHADFNMLESIIRNLISNAIKYSENNSEIKISAYEEGENIIILVKDFGIGMSEEHQKKLFNIGEDVVTFGTNNEKGTGLGLLLCKEFVKEHNGKIWFESIKGEGTTFYVSLPKKDM